MRQILRSLRMWKKRQPICLPSSLLEASCLRELEHKTKPVERKDVVYLYWCDGTKRVWRVQRMRLICKYNALHWFAFATQSSWHANVAHLILTEQLRNVWYQKKHLTLSQKFSCLRFPTLHFYYRLRIRVPSMTLSFFISTATSILPISCNWEPTCHIMHINSVEKNL